MSLAEKFRSFPTPGYGVCGGADRDCAIGDFDPMDKLFFKHDNDLYAAHQIQDAIERSTAEKAADATLEEGLRNLTDADMDKIPAWTWKPPFFKRWYAKLYRREALKVFS
jgi:hypothetical protein